jgi:hypothetical protein
MLTPVLNQTKVLETHVGWTHVLCKRVCGRRLSLRILSEAKSRVHLAHVQLSVVLALRTDEICR